MYTIDTSTFWLFVQSFFGLVGGALKLDPAAFRAVQTSADANLLTVLILLLAGASAILGQSVVLLANKVTPRRFVSSLFFNGAVFVVGVLIWSAIFLLVGRFVFGESLLFTQMVRAIGLAYAPFLLSFFILLPYFGSCIDHVLDVWCVLAMLVALEVTLQLHFWQALVCALLGWVIIQLLKSTIGRPVMAAYNWLWQKVSGTALSRHMQELITPPGAKTTDEQKGGGAI